MSASVAQGTAGSRVSRNALCASESHINADDELSHASIVNSLRADARLDLPVVPYIYATMSEHVSNRQAADDLVAQVMEHIDAAEETDGSKIPLRMLALVEPLSIPV